MLRYARKIPLDRKHNPIIAMPIFGYAEPPAMPFLEALSESLCERLEPEEGHCPFSLMERQATAEIDLMMSYA